MRYFINIILFRLEIIPGLSYDNSHLLAFFLSITVMRVITTLKSVISNPNVFDLVLCILFSGSNPFT